MNKYRNIKTVVDGFTFHSRKEAFRYQALKLLEKAGEITDLKLQPVYNFVLDDKRIFTYKGDFEYKLDGEIVLEDVKGYKTPIYNLKKKIIEAVYKISILET